MTTTVPTWDFALPGREHLEHTARRVLPVQVPDFTAAEASGESGAPPC
jgi:hypothetical protein